MGGSFFFHFLRSHSCCSIAGILKKMMSVALSVFEFKLVGIDGEGERQKNVDFMDSISTHPL